MAMKRRVGWRIKNNPQIVWWEIVIPPVVMVGTHNAGCYADALENQTFSRRLLRFIAAMRSKAFVSMNLLGGDSDARNLKYYTHRMNLEHGRPSPSNCLMVFSACMLHQGNMNVGSVCEYIGVRYVSAMESYANLLHMGNYWVRTILSIEQGVKDLLDIYYSPPPRHSV
jgi:hypothetical protein